MESLNSEFDRVFRNYYAHIVAYLRKGSGDNEGAKDLAQEVFMRYLKRRENGEVIHDPYAWLLRTAQNIQYNHSRSPWNRQVKLCGLEVQHQNRDEPLYPESIALYEEEALSLLDEQEYDIFLLVAFHRCPYTDVSRQLGMSPGRVARSYHNACRIMRFALESKGLVCRMELL